MNQRKFFEKSKIGLSTSSKKELSNFLRTVFHRKNRNLMMINLSTQYYLFKPFLIL